MGEQLEKRQLWKHDENSSKYYSARLLLGYSDGHFKINNYFVYLADRVKRTWNDHKKLFKLMKKPDENLRSVMDFYFTNKDFQPSNSELAVHKAILDEKSTSKILLKNPQLKRHEENRLETILQTLKQYHNNVIISTDDPRQAMTVILTGRMDKKQVILQNYSSINKIFPKFWKCIS